MNFQLAKGLKCVVSPLSFMCELAWCLVSSVYHRIPYYVYHLCVRSSNYIQSL